MPKIENRTVVYSSAPKKKGMTIGNSIEISEPDPPIQACDQILGHYLRRWNQIEYAFSDLFQKLSGAHPTAVRIILASGLHKPTLREIILALAGQRLTEADCLELENFLSREKKATANRNKLVHGKWRLSVFKGEKPPHKATWERFYEPTDPRLFAKMHGKNADQKVRAAHIFSLSRISELADNVSKLSQEIRDFTSRLTVIEFLDAQPVKSFSE